MCASVALTCLGALAPTPTEVLRHRQALSPLVPPSGPKFQWPPSQCRRERPCDLLVATIQGTLLSREEVFTTSLELTESVFSSSLELAKSVLVTV